MMGFENYDVRAWASDGLTHHVAQAKKALNKAFRRGASSNAIALAASIAFAALVGASATAMTPLQFANHSIAVPDSISYSRVASVKAAAFWRSVRADVRRWKPMQEVDLAEPPELI
jgi:hypothetical protein